MQVVLEMEMQSAYRSIASFRGHVTRNIRYLTEAISGGAGAPYLGSLRISLEKKWDNYEAKWVEFCNTYGEEEGQSDREMAHEGISDSYHEIQLNLSVYLKNNAAPPPPQPPQGQHKTKIVLPDIKLKEFTGNRLDWTRFWNQYDSTVNARLDLDQVTKYMYLTQCIKGPAQKVLAGFKGKASDYEDAIKALHKAYGDKDKIRRTLIRNLINLSRPKCDKNEIFNFKVDLDNFLMQLDHDPDIDVESNEMLLRELITMKLPKEVEDFLFNKHATMYFSVEQIMEGLECFLVKLEAESKRDTSSAKDDNKQKFQSSPVSSPLPSNSTAVGTYTTFSNLSCIYCKGGHRPYECKTYSTINSRKDRLKTLKRCIKCTKAHMSPECKTVLSLCPHCKKGNHHSFLCVGSQSSNKSMNHSSRTNNDDSDKVSGDPAATNQVMSIMNGSYTSFNYGVALPTATVIVKSENGQSMKVRCLFDSGSQRSFIHKDLANELGLKQVAKADMVLNSFDNTGAAMEYVIVKPLVTLGNRKKKIVLAVVNDMPSQIVTPGLSETMKNLNNKGHHLADMGIQSDVVDNIRILIGSDFLGRFVSGMKSVENIDVLESSGGYLIYGVIPYVSNTPIRCNSTLVARVTTHTRVDTPLLTEPRTSNSCVVYETLPVHQLWDLDVVGINPLQQSPSDTKAMSQYESTVKHSDGRYWVELPFKCNHPFLPNNYSLALAQMHNQIRRFQSQPELLKCYDDIIKEQLKLDFIEVVENPIVSCNTHYLPHHAVGKESSTTPIRIVYNCSAKKDKSSASLNDCLMTGPSLTEKLFDSLIKFRTNAFAGVADIEKAFLQVGLQEHHRDFTRFLWPEDPFEESSRVKTFRFKSVLFGATCSPFLLQMTLQHHFYQSSSLYADVLSSSFYVDNLQLVADNEQYIVKLYEVANSELNKAGMNLRQWNTNSSLLKDHIIKKSDEMVEFPPVNKVLGLNWEISSDLLFLNHCQFKPLQYITKRQLLSLVSTCFDPLGMCAPILIKGKRLIQDAWRMEVGWDVRLPHSYLNQWNTLAQEIGELPSIKFPRCMCQLGGTYTLHVFVDASTVAYGAVCYLSDKEQSCFVASKARVAPLKTRTLPQLELTALQLGTQFASCIATLCHQFCIEEIIIWSDSEVALQWLKNGNSKIIYVQNRVTSIKEIGSSFKYQYVPTQENPADLLTRGISIKQFKGSNIWIHGPSWLCYPYQWPKQKFEVLNCEIVSETIPDVPIPEPIFDYCKYSSLRRLLLVTRFVYKFIQSVTGYIVSTNPLVYWIKYVQELHYPSISAFLKGKLGSLEHDKLQFIREMGLYYDECTGLLHCRGRLHHADLDQGTKFPILIPTKSHLAYLLIIQAHQMCLHGGIKDTLSCIRRQYWMPKAIQSIKKYIRQCVTCKRVEGKKFGYPGPPPLPIERVKFSRPFEHVGIDYSGPITITKTKDGGPHKYYIVLFTCTASRLIHLELASDMKAYTFINIFRRFCATYSYPNLVISDNGSNFVASAKFFRELLSQKDVQRYMDSFQIRWQFIAPRAPWQGRFYERLISLTKSCLKKVLFKKRVDREELQTVLKEIQCKLNNRPLTYIDSEIPLEPLAPIHLWCGRIINPFPGVMLDDPKDPEFLDHSDLNEQFTQVSSIINHFATVWKRDYLTALREKHYGGSQAYQECAPRVGDVVIVERSGPQQEWPLGRIVKLYHDSENVIRVVDVLCEGVVTKRTLDKLVPLEIHSPCADTPIVSSEESQTVSDETDSQRGVSESEISHLRPSRRAAEKAAKLRQFLIENDQI